MQVESNSNNARGGVSGSVGRAWTRIKNFFAASWAYFKSSHATFSSLGDDLITSAQKDLTNLKGKLENLWDIQDEDKQTTALYIAAILGKFGFTFIIVGVSIISSLSKLTIGSCCLLLAGRWLTLLSRVFNTFSESFVQTARFIKNAMKSFVTNVLDLCNKIIQKLGNYIGRFLNAILGFFKALTSYLSRACKMVLDTVAAITRRFVSVVRWFGNVILNAWRFTLDFLAATRRAILGCIKEIGRFVSNVIRNLGNAAIHCFKGVGHLALGTIIGISIIAKGLGLSVAALFIETGIASSLSGLAKTMFILDESLAAGMGAIVDGVYASGKSFFKACKLLFGYGITPDATPVRATANIVSQDAANAAEFETDTEVSNDAVLDDSAYFRNKFLSNMHYVNEGVASIGNQALNSYQMQKNSLVGASGWSHEQDHEAVGLVSRDRPTMSNA